MSFSTQSVAGFSVIVHKLTQRQASYELENPKVE
jgi:hypothetical protein